MDHEPGSPSGPLRPSQVFAPLPPTPPSTSSTSSTPSPSSPSSPRSTIVAHYAQQFHVRRLSNKDVDLNARRSIKLKHLCHQLRHPEQLVDSMPGVEKHTQKAAELQEMPTKVQPLHQRMRAYTANNTTRIEIESPVESELPVIPMYLPYSVAHILLCRADLVVESAQRTYNIRTVHSSPSRCVIGAHPMVWLGADLGAKYMAYAEQYADISYASCSDIGGYLMDNIETFVERNMIAPLLFAHRVRSRTMDNSIAEES